MPKNTNALVMASVGNLEKVLATSVNRLGDALKIQGPEFFKNGIELITIRAKVVEIEVELTVAGPHPNSRVAESGAATSGPSVSTPSTSDPLSRRVRR